MKESYIFLVLQGYHFMLTLAILLIRIMIYYSWRHITVHTQRLSIAQTDSTRPVIFCRNGFILLSITESKIIKLAWKIKWFKLYIKDLANFSETEIQHLSKKQKKSLPLPAWSLALEKHTFLMFSSPLPAFQQPLINLEWKDFSIKLLTYYN